MSTEQMRFAKRICKKIINLFDGKTGLFAVSGPLNIAYFAFADIRRKDKVQGYGRIHSITLQLNNL